MPISQLAAEFIQGDYSHTSGSRSRLLSRLKPFGIGHVLLSFGALGLPGAGSAVAPRRPLSESRILWRVLVSLRTMGLAKIDACRTRTTSIVDWSRYGLKVARVATQPITTKVVDFPAGWDRTNLVQIDNDVCKDGLSGFISPEVAVAAAAFSRFPVLGASPGPTFVRAVNGDSSPDANGGGDGFSGHISPSRGVLCNG